VHHSPIMSGLSSLRNTALSLAPGRVDGAAAPRAWEEPRRGGEKFLVAPVSLWYHVLYS